MPKKEKSIKIAFVGTSCTGKTAIIETYRRRFKNNPKVAFVEEAARIYFQNNPHVIDRFSVDAQGKVQALALSNEQSAHATGARVILCDRSVIDAVAYVKAQGNKEGSEELLQKVEFWLPTYYKLLLLDPADISYSRDEVRQENESKRWQFHETFIELFEEKQISYELLSGVIEERTARIDQILAEALHLSMQQFKLFNGFLKLQKARKPDSVLR